MNLKPFKIRLNDFFKRLRKAGYFAKQNFWCYQTCAWGDVPKEAKKVVFYYSQDAADIKEKNQVYLDWLGDGKEICDIAEQAGLKVEWAGVETKRILVKG